LDAAPGGRVAPRGPSMWGAPTWPPTPPDARKRPGKPGALLDDGSVRGGGRAEDGGRDAVDHDVDDGGLAGGDGALEGRGEIGRALDVLAVPAESLGDAVVARRQQRASDRTFG